MGLYISASGMLTVLERQWVTANNVANWRTAGYRAQTAHTSESAVGGARVDSVRTDNSAGPLEYTGQPLDLASSEGFFQVQLPDGSMAYTRDGHFGLDANGDVVTSSGARLMPPVSAPAGATSVSVTASGQVYATLPGAMTPQPAGQISVFTFSNPNGLQALGGNLFSASDASGPAQPAAAEVWSRTLESSNVDLTRETVHQVLDLQTFRANLNAFSAQDEVIGELLDLKQ